MGYNETVSVGEAVPQVEAALRGLESALSLLETAAPELGSRIESILTQTKGDGSTVPEPAYDCHLAQLINQQARRVRTQAEYLFSVKSRVEL